MKPRISSNAQMVFRAMLAKKAACERELSAAAKPIAVLCGAETKKILQAEIYDVPIPLKPKSDRKLSAKAAVRSKTTKGKHGKWQRSGALKRRETAYARGVNVILENKQSYAASRHALGTPGHRQIRSPGVRSVQWQKQAVERLLPRIRAIRRTAIRRVLLTK